MTLKFLAETLANNFKKMQHLYGDEPGRHGGGLPRAWCWTALRIKHAEPGRCADMEVRL